MAFVFAYTKKGKTYYDSKNPENYPGCRAFNCDLQDAMHLALSRDGKSWTPLRNGTGILFPKADYTQNIPGGVTKTLLDPWIFRRADAGFGVCAVRRNQNAPDPDSVGTVMLFWSKDLVRYEEAGFLQVAEEEIRHPRCRYDEKTGAYELEWSCRESVYGGRTRDFRTVEETGRREAFRMKNAADCGIANAMPGNIVEITEEEAKILERFFGVIENIGTDAPDLTVRAGKKPDFASLPKAVCSYSDGSVHEKPVDWNRETFDGIDFDVPGKYEITGRIRQKHYPFPFIKEVLSDPCVCAYQGRYFLSASGHRSVTFRIGDTLKALADAKPFAIYELPESDRVHANMWAPEMHVIHGVPYVFTTVGKREWSTVRSHVLRCVGDPANPADWEAPRLVRRPGGEELQGRGISLDMTYFEVDGTHYVMWSDRVFEERSEERTVADSADICIARIDPDAPWQLVTEPVRILRPLYGWDRCETPVDEGPYLLRRGEDLFVTISGSSTGLADLYCLGLLHAKAGSDLLREKSWEWLPWPVLTKESVPGQFGPGHNCFLKDPDTGDDLLIYHAVPHDAKDRALGRHMGIRRVHWAKSGYPYLEMTPGRDVRPEFETVRCNIYVEGEGENENV